MIFKAGDQIDNKNEDKKTIPAIRPLSRPPRVTTSHNFFFFFFFFLGGGGGPDPRFLMYLCMGIFGKSAQKKSSSRKSSSILRDNTNTCTHQTVAKKMHKTLILLSAVIANSTQSTFMTRMGIRRTCSRLKLPQVATGENRERKKVTNKFQFTET